MRHQLVGHIVNAYDEYEDLQEKRENERRRAREEREEALRRAVEAEAREQEGLQS